MQYDWSYFEKSAEYVKSRIDFEPQIGIILGSGLGELASKIENPTVIDYADIPNFLVSTVKSHAGKLILGSLGGKRVACMSGRFHTYEGYDIKQLVTPIRFFKCLGIKAAIITNVAGAINTAYHPGDIMLIRDHIKLWGPSPLCGENADDFGPRFFDTTDMYTKALRRLAMDCAKDCPLKVHEGVYFFFSGPQFETPSEINAARLLGGDAAGMSTVPEVLTAAHCRMPLLGLSVMVNMAAGVEKGPICDDEMDNVIERITNDFSTYVEKIITSIEPNEL